MHFVLSDGGTVGVTGSIEFFNDGTVTFPGESGAVVMDSSRIEALFDCDYECLAVREGRELRLLEPNYLDTYAF